MNSKIVFPSEYHSHYMIPTQPEVGYYQPQPILHHVPDEALSGVQDDFLAGENIKRVGNLTLPLRQSVDLLATVCQKLSTCGSLKEVPIGGSRGLPWTQTYQGLGPSIRPATSAIVQGYSHTLSGWMKEFRGSSEHYEALQDAIQNGPEYLACDKMGVSISPHIDFGLKHTGSRSSVGESVPRYFRTLMISNNSRQSVLLLDICGIPSVNHIFVFHDDYGLAHHYHQVSDNPQKYDNFEAPKGVLLQTNAQYQVTVELQCNPEDCSIHQQWLMFTFALGHGKTPLQNIATKESVFIVGRRVSALVVKNVQDVHTCLSTEAKPFYPLSLRTLFDREPAHFSFADTSPCRKFMDFICRQNSSLQIGHLSVWRSSFSTIENYLESFEGTVDTANSSSNHGTVPPLSSQCACYRRQLRQQVRLLGLEEAAMEFDIREHDLLNIQMDYHNVRENQFTIEVPGLPENRPCVFIGDKVYVRWANIPNQECAALVLAVETQHKPQIVIKLSEEFLVPLISQHISQHINSMDVEGRGQRLKLQRVHVRFMIDRLIIKNMHAALHRTAKSTAKILPCICTSTTTSNESALLNNESDTNTKENRKNAAHKSKFLLINKCLNEEQQKAVKAVLDEVDGPGPYIIFGPPGTGKTVTVVECVLQVLKTKKSPLLCVCAPSNYAADILCSGIGRGGITPAFMWRLNDPRRTSSSVKADVLKFCTTKHGYFTFDVPNSSTLKVIVCTCAAAAMLHEDPLTSIFSSVTHILIDEAGQALIPEALIPLSLANRDTCCVLCGDPRQLGPVVHSKLAATNGLAKSLLEHFMLSPEYSLEAGPPRPGSTRIIKLLRNYRANSKLLELPSRMFYEDELIAAAEETSVAPPHNWDEMNGIGFPMLFYGVKGQQMREGESPSYFNPVETIKVADLISGLLKTNVTMEDIGVMAPYRRQVQKLRLLLRSRGLGAIRVGTVDDYQGQEEKIIFISTVLTRPESLKRAQAGGGPEQNIGFLSNAKRFNVAITRAKAMLVVVGHPVILSKDDNWRELLKYCLPRGAFRGYGSDRITSFLPSTSEGNPFSSSDAKDVESSKSTTETDARERKEVDDAIELIAEMSLLGLGDMERIYPDNLDSFYAANSEDQEWRVVL